MTRGGGGGKRKQGGEGGVKKNEILHVAFVTSTCSKRGLYTSKRQCFIQYNHASSAHTCTYINFTSTKASVSSLLLSITGRSRAFTTLICTVPGMMLSLSPKFPTVGSWLASMRFKGHLSQ